MTIDEKKLQQVREKINQLDVELLPLLIERFALTHTVEISKLEQFIGTSEVISPLKMLAREQDIIENIRTRIDVWLATADNKEKLNQHHFADKAAAAINQIYYDLFDQALSFEQQQTVATLGPVGTWSQLATQVRFGKNIRMNLAPDIPSVFENISSKSSMWGVVPYENSTNGPVNLTLDSFEQHDLQIVGEFTIPIRHCLSGREGNTNYVDRKRVYGHSQSLAQCGPWLRNNISKEIDMVPCASNGHAIKMAKEDLDSLALSAKSAVINDDAKQDRLSIFAEGIDLDTNQTRFVIISQTETKPTGNDKTSIKIRVGRETGSLHTIMGILKDAKIDTTMLHSRPSKDKPWAYVFYMDINGHRDDKVVATVLEKINAEKNLVVSLQVLGSYKKGLMVHV